MQKEEGHRERQQVFSPYTAIRKLKELDKHQKRKSIHLQHKETEDIPCEKSLSEGYKKDIETLEAKAVDFRTRTNQLDFTLMSFSSLDSHVKEF